MNTNKQIDVANFKEVDIFTPQGVVTFDIKELYKVEGYGKYEKNRLDSILKRIVDKVGVLKVVIGGKETKIDLTTQILPARIVTKK